MAPCKTDIRSEEPQCINLQKLNEKEINMSLIGNAAIVSSTKKQGY